MNSPLHSGIQAYLLLYGQSELYSNIANKKIGFVGSGAKKEWTSDRVDWSRWNTLDYDYLMKHTGCYQSLVKDVYLGKENCLQWIVKLRGILKLLPAVEQIALCACRIGIDKVYE